MQRFDLTGKVAIVTGGNGGIGFGMAQGLADAGASLLIVGRNAEKNAAAKARLAAAGGRVESFIADLAQEQPVRDTIADAVRRFGRLDILVNNAGINIRKAPQDYTLAEWQRVIDINLTGLFVACHAAYPVLRQAGGGKIINIGSMMSLFGTPFVASYAASKGGVVQLTKALATAWAKDNIQVNAVLPGWIDTELTQRARAEVPKLNERVLDRTPAGRWGTGQDMAGIAVFLASAASDFITGTAIPVDGGFAAQG